MNQENGHKKIIVTILVLLLMLLVAAFLIYWLRPQKTTPQIGTDDTTFSPFERPVDRTIDVQSPETPYTYVPTLETPPEREPEPTIVNSAPTIQSSFYYPETQTQSFNIPPSSAPTNGNVYTIDSGGISYVPIPYDTGAYYQPTYRYSTSTPDTSGQGDKKTFKDLDKEVFGYISGLGWTQLLGDTGQQIYDILYGMSPNGGTAGTIGDFLPGAGGGDGGGGGIGALGGLGGGGGGTTQEFGGEVSRVTQCTCSNSSMLDIKDVRGQTISVIFQNGKSKLFREANINGTGQNVLGTYSSGGSCLVYHGEDCTSEGSPKGTIVNIGTSK